MFVVPMFRFGLERFLFKVSGLGPAWARAVRWRVQNRQVMLVMLTLLSGQATRSVRIAFVL